MAQFPLPRPGFGAATPRRDLNPGGLPAPGGAFSGVIVYPSLIRSPEQAAAYAPFATPPPAGARIDPFGPTPFGLPRSPDNDALMPPGSFRPPAPF